jgi:hypothetical protein
MPAPPPFAQEVAMPEVTRTVRRWLAAARHLRDADPALAGRVRAALAARPSAHLDAHLDDPLAVELSAAEAAGPSGHTGRRPYPPQLD